MTWHDMNQRYLMAALESVARNFEAVLQGGLPGDPAGRDGHPPENVMREMSQAMSPPPAIETLHSAFGLSPFERSILLTCAGVELDAGFARLVAAVADNQGQPGASFSLFLACLPEPHWSALVPTAPLRYWQLVRPSAGGSHTATPMRIDERILHFLTGVPTMDEALVDLVRSAEPPPALAPAHQRRVSHVATLLNEARAGGQPPVVYLLGHDAVTARHIAASACDGARLSLYCMHADTLPADHRDLSAFQRLWQRQTALSGAALLLDFVRLDSSADPSARSVKEQAADWITEETDGPILVCGRLRRPNLRRRGVSIFVDKPPFEEQRGLWALALGDAGLGLNGRLDSIAGQFDLDASAIGDIASDALGRSVRTGSSPAELGEALLDAARQHEHRRLEALAQHVPAIATWADLVLPPAQVQTLKQIAAHVRNRRRVYGQWGFASKSSRGLGIGMLFSGPAGTGKTMAAEVLAGDLGMELYRVDLSSVVSKYIGETEKNLARIFDAAEDGGVVLLFDEADALFGKRSEVRDSHDRYANIEVSYLLQRMEAHLGLAILTTNMKTALDTAFLRRLRFVVQFPFPDGVQREEIWRRVFPASTPLGDLDFKALARLSVAGGNIRNIAMNAAFLAADADEPVTMRHIASATRTEYAKLEKTLTDSEIRNWV